jgi:predicted ArsR family transcriptional regulator
MEQTMVEHLAINDVARILNVSRNSVRRHLPVLHIGRRVLVRFSDLQQLISSDRTSDGRDNYSSFSKESQQ